MFQYRPFVFLVLVSCFFSGATVYARSAGANQPAGLPSRFEVAQAEEGPDQAPIEGEVTEGPAQPEMQAAFDHGPRPDAHHGPGSGGWGGHTMGNPDPEVGLTDHQRVIGHWGIEARSVATLQSSQNNPDPACEGATSAATGCRDVRLTSVGVRKWVSNHYAYSAGLALAMGGGSTKGRGTWDTHIGIGPTVGAFFLLTQWKHLAISATPQLGLLYFAPSGSGQKTFSVDLQGKIEAELQLGFIGLPGFAVGTDAGLGLRYMNVGNADDKNSGGYSRWGINSVGTSTPWGLVTNAFLRFYL